ncbi:hypothetical protein [Chryseobacterium sp. JM1]|uniref:hypothetical protein n=1 Tax=Chryseobacterium sp. JM1 TaxID=1233950 RepID=UPI0004E6AF19|nr:hypothetical protein [Chryseobacterium sp. JM1]KFF18135.1 hypothetical protein IW22_19350 [Chryseobacterium sp. JM1]
MNQLYGKVRSVKKYSSGELKTESMYTPEGTISEIKLYKKGILASIEKRYEKEGMEVKEIHRLGENTPKMILCHYKDSSGNLNWTEYYDSDFNFLEKKDIGKTSIEYNATGKLNSFSKNAITLFQKQFDKSHKALEEISFSDSGQIIYIIKYFYHENTITRKSFDAEKRLVKLRHLIMDEKQRIVQSFKFSREEIGNDCMDYHESYNAEHMTRITTDDLKNISYESLPEISKISLDETSLYTSVIKSLLNEFRYDLEGKELPGQPSIDFFVELTDVTYDDADREVSHAKYAYWSDFNEKELSLIEYIAHTYDNQNLLTAHSYSITEKNHDFGGSYQYTYEFDAENRIIKKITTGDSNCVTHISYENGNRIETECDEDSDRKITHIFDMHNNLIYYEDASEKRNWKWSKSYEITYY